MAVPWATPLAREPAATNRPASPTAEPGGRRFIAAALATPGAVPAVLACTATAGCRLHAGASRGQVAAPDNGAPQDEAPAKAGHRRGRTNPPLLRWVESEFDPTSEKGETCVSPFKTWQPDKGSSPESAGPEISRSLRPGRRHSL